MVVPLPVVMQAIFRPISGRRSPGTCWQRCRRPGDHAPPSQVALRRHPTALPPPSHRGSCSGRRRLPGPDEAALVLFTSGRRRLAGCSPLP